MRFSIEADPVFLLLVLAMQSFADGNDSRKKAAELDINAAPEFFQWPVVQPANKTAASPTDGPGRIGIQSSLTINTSERGVPSDPMPSCASQSEVNMRKWPSLEMLPRGCV